MRSSATEMRQRQRRISTDTMPVACVCDISRQAETVRETIRVHALDFAQCATVKSERWVDYRACQNQLSPQTNPVPLESMRSAMLRSSQFEQFHKVFLFHGSIDTVPDESFLWEKLRLTGSGFTTQMESKCEFIARSNSLPMNWECCQVHRKSFPVTNNWFVLLGACNNRNVFFEADSDFVLESNICLSTASHTC